MIVIASRGIVVTSSRTISIFGMRFNSFGDVVGELFSIDGQRRAGGNARRRGRFHHQRACAPQFFLQKIGCGAGFVGFQRV